MFAYHVIAHVIYLFIHFNPEGLFLLQSLFSF